MAYLTTRLIDESDPLSVNFFPHSLLSTIPAKSASSGEMQWAHLRIMQWAASHRYKTSNLLQESAPIYCVKDVGVLLEDFVRKVELFYGKKYVKFNIHLLTYLSKSVLDWGCTLRRVICKLSMIIDKFARWLCPAVGSQMPHPLIFYSTKNIKTFTYETICKHTRLHWCRKGVEGAKGFKKPWRDYETERIWRSPWAIS